MKLHEEGEVLERLTEAIQPGPSELVSPREASGRILRDDLFATLANPPFDNSSVDGYALSSGDLTAGSVLRCQGEQSAGTDHRHRVSPGVTIRIFTGAPLPLETVAVAMQEDCRVREDGNVEIETDHQPGENIRRRGADCCVGQLLAAGGTRLAPRHLALLASQGIASLSLAQRPRVAIFSTGDELKSAGEPLLPGQIYESNLGMLCAMATSWQAKVTAGANLPDALETTTETLHLAAAEHDFLVISGGVSVGERDFVKQAIRQAGGQLDLWRINLKPGKPFLFGRIGECFIFGLPGNPVSSFVTALLFVRHALLLFQGASPAVLRLPTFALPSGGRLVNEGSRPHYQRGELREGRFHAPGLQQSHALASLARSNALARLPGNSVVEKGEPLDVVLLDAW